MAAKVVVKLEFESALEVAQWIDSHAPIEGAGNHSVTNDKRDGWDLSLGYDATVDMARSGGAWLEGADKMRKGVAAAQAKHEQRAAPAFGMEVAGFAVDVPTYLAGVPDCMWTMAESDSAQAPIVRIAIGTFSGGTDARHALNRGIAVMCLVDALEGAGHRCEVDAYWDGTNHYAPGGAGSKVTRGDHWQTRVKIKLASDHWNPQSAAFLSAHPAAFRRLEFAIMERVDNAACQSETSDGSYGYGSNLGLDEYDIAQPYMRTGAGYTSMDDALRSVQTFARDAGYDVTLIED